MGTTLQNGVYLPNEGERNCYAGLKTNWEILDQKVADVTALQQAVAGALHREIVESLPTTDIDPNTIYMILSGTSATENVYDEYMYVNNAWELIGTSATDLTNYYTKGDVDGLLLLKANASDLTSHTGDTTIHVTSADKSKWNTVALIKQLRLVNTRVGSATTIAFANIDDTNGIKVGDKCMDLDAKMFEITAVDTTNQTVTVGSALIDLALDGDVVHKSGDETVGGEKTFDSNTYIYNSDNTATTPNLILKNSKSSKGSTSEIGAQLFKFFDKNNATLGEIESTVTTNGASELRLKSNNLDSNNQNVQTGVTLITNTNGAKRFCPTSNGDVSCGHSTLKWSNVYATNYYYGSDNIEFSTKFVTTDTTQTISGNKTFSDNLTIYNSDDTQTPKGLTIRNAQWGMGESGGTTVSNINFLDKNSSIPASVMASKGLYGQSFLRFSVRTKDSQNNTYSEEIYYDIDTSGNVEFRSWHDNIISLGTSAYKWKDVQTSRVNGLTPSSLSLPSDRSARIDISSYFTNTGTGNTNDYSVPANGFIFLNLLNTFAVICYSIDGTNNTNYAQSYFRQVDGQIYVLFPVRKNDTFRTLWTSNGGTITVTGAHFIPCQGNI